MAAPVLVPQGFTRRLKPGDPVLIESRCDFCGLLITGSIMHGLTDNELAHRKNCPGKLKWQAKSAVARRAT